MNKPYRVVVTIDLPIGHYVRWLRRNGEVQRYADETDARFAAVAMRRLGNPYVEYAVHRIPEAMRIAA